MNVASFILFPLFIISTVLGLEDEWRGSDDMPVLHAAFVQTGAELQFLSSEASPHDATLFVGGDSKRRTLSAPSADDEYKLIFEPSILDFGKLAVGVPQVRKVRLRNEGEKVLRIDSILGVSHSLHSSFVDDSMLEPGRETSLSVVFLGRREGAVEEHLQLHTSWGVFSYRVRGVVSSNPYRLPPFVGVRVPLNGSFERLLSLHNPHPHTLRITEVQSSGGDLHFESPAHSDPSLASDPVHYWDIRPFHTRSIGRISMLGAVEQNSTRFVKIKTQFVDSNKKSSGEESVVVSLPVEVTQHRGLFPTAELLDFGFLPHGTRSPQLLFSIFSTLTKNIDIETVYVKEGEANGVYLEFASSPPISVPTEYSRRRIPSGDGAELPLSGRPVDLVKVAFDSTRLSLVGDDKDKKMKKNEPFLRTFSGSLVAVSRGGNYNVSIPFIATIYTGEVSVVGDDTALHSGETPPAQRGVRLRNGLPFGVAIWNVSLDESALPYFTVRMFERVVAVGRGETRSVFSLKYNKKAPRGFSSKVTVYTNVSSFSVPIYVYDGRVQVSVQSLDPTHLDFGLIEPGDSRSIRLVVRNDNPALVTVQGLRAPLAHISQLRVVRFESLRKSTKTDTLQLDAPWTSGSDLEIAAFSSVLLDIVVRVPSDGAVHSGEFHVNTDFESHVFPVSYEVAKGGFVSVPSVLDFGHTHPGYISYRNLQMFNSFSSDARVLRVTTVSRDSRIFLESLDASKAPVLRAGRLSNVGRVLLMPATECLDDCYVGVPLHTPDGQWFVHGLSLPHNLAEIDSYLYKRARAKFNELVEAGRHRVNATLLVDTTSAKNVETRAELVWPRLLTRPAVHFPLTALGNFTIVNLTLANPSTRPVVVQLIPLVIYPDAEALLHFFRDELATPLTGRVEMNETLMFSLRDTELFTLKPDSPVPKLREEVEKVVGMNVPRPHARVRIRLGFLPSDLELRSSLLLIRNNLTLLEPVVLYGRGARIGMRVEGVEARSRDPLLFEIRHEHLSDCHNPKRLMHKLTSTLTVRRQFVVLNTGEVAFTVVNMSISGFPCENRGFKILNCFSFRLQPNDSYALEVAYTPDFLSSNNEADLQLYVHMNSSAWLFPLVAAIPPDMLAKCHSALPRPPFENLMYYSFCLICVMACAYLEGDRAIGCAIRAQFAVPAKVFDLNAVAASVSNSAQNGAAKGTVERRVDAKKVVVRRSMQAATIHAAPDAGAVVVTLCRLANYVLWLVSFVWRLSFLWRPDDDNKNTTAQPSRRRKRAPIARKNPHSNPAPEPHVEFPVSSPAPAPPPVTVENKLSQRSPRAVTKAKEEWKRKDEEERRRREENCMKDEKRDDDRKDDEEKRTQKQSIADRLKKYQKEKEKREEGERERPKTKLRKKKSSGTSGNNSEVDSDAGRRDTEVAREMNGHATLGPVEEKETSKELKSDDELEEPEWADSADVDFEHVDEDFSALAEETRLLFDDNAENEQKKEDKEEGQSPSPPGAIGWEKSSRERERGKKLIHKLQDERRREYMELGDWPMPRFEVRLSSLVDEPPPGSSQGGIWPPTPDPTSSSWPLSSPSTLAPVDPSSLLPLLSSPSAGSSKSPKDDPLGFSGSLFSRDFHPWDNQRAVNSDESWAPVLRSTPDEHN